jgi:hypothetical protein
MALKASSYLHRSKAHTHTMAIDWRYHVTWFKKRKFNETILFYSTPELPLRRRLLGLDLFLDTQNDERFFIKNKRNREIFSKKHNQRDYKYETFEDSLRFWSECHSTVFTMGEKGKFHLESSPQRTMATDWNEWAMISERSSESLAFFNHGFNQHYQ